MGVAPEVRFRYCHFEMGSYGEKGTGVRSQGWHVIAAIVVFCRLLHEESILLG